MKNYTLNFDKTVTSWDEAIPLGNGMTGALIWGDSRGLRFSLDRGDLWDTTPYPDFDKEEFTYANLVSLVEKKDIHNVRRIFDALYSYPTPTKLPAGKIVFDFNEDSNVRSQLDITGAEATIEIPDDKGNIRIRSFVHAEDDMGCLHINRPLGDFSFSIENPEFGTKEKGPDEFVYDVEKRAVSIGSLDQLKYEEPSFHSESNTIWFRQRVNNSFQYGIFLSWKEREGAVEMVYKIVRDTSGEKWERESLASLEAALSLGYDSLLETHRTWWSRFFGSSSLSLPETMFEEQWYLTNYLFGSCSRKGCPPMPLQGVWTADNGELPPWKGDYHGDLNTQMSYTHYLKANHLEEGESYIDFLWSHVDNARKFAREFYGTGGLCLPPVMTIDAQPLGGWAQYSLAPTNQIWTALAFEKHYRHQGDENFLKEKAYPYLSETAECLLGLLKENEKGELVLPISASPEIHDDRAESWLTPNSNYDQSLLIYLFDTLIEFSQILADGRIGEWREARSKLADLEVNKDSVLMLSPDESLQESHRHHAHAMAIHPLRLLKASNKRDKEIMDATILNMEFLGTGQWVGFSFSWMAEIYAVQKNGNGAHYQLKLFWENFCSQNGFNLNGDFKKKGLCFFHYRPFTLEANMAAANALQEMLLYTEKDVIELFPAIPDNWLEETVSFNNFVGDKGMSVSAIREGGLLKSLTIKSQNEGVYKLRKDFDLSQYSIETEIEYSEGETDLILNLKKDQLFSMTHKG